MNCQIGRNLQTKNNLAKLEHVFAGADKNLIKKGKFSYMSNPVGKQYSLLHPIDAMPRDAIQFQYFLHQFYHLPS